MRIICPNILAFVLDRHRIVFDMWEAFNLINLMQVDDKA